MSGRAKSAAAVGFKVVLLGEGRVGKTSLALRFVHAIFSPHQPATVQAAYLSKVVLLPNGADVSLFIWDTAGQERFHALGPIYYRDANAALLVYDVTEADSLERVKQWVAEVRLMGPPGIVMAVAANKIDLLRDAGGPDASALVQAGKMYADEIGAIFVQTSAKDDVGVAQVFTTLAQEMHARQLSHHGRAAGAVSGRHHVAPLTNRKTLLVVDDDGSALDTSPVAPAGNQQACCT